MKKTRPKRWDRHEIMAEIRRRGTTLRAVAVNAGLEKNGCSVALIRPFPAAEVAISAFLKVPLHELWPDRYSRSPSSRRDPTTEHPEKRSLNGSTVQTVESMRGAA